ncbi:hypothetical protein LSH36_2003g00011 [Paralvinella palmiformis]|uniref:Uncharacterized protein n=1 Tax=Paralvinella palmiformis TaxID=53620 RepID=A0AAD9IQI2_9ANNE|nr:hypothetical protein LSH36_2003g00011 [Paralvinella palmiformis]
MTLPTIGFNVVRIRHDSGLVLMVWDIGGQSKVRRLWRDYCKELEDAVGPEELAVVLDLDKHDDVFNCHVQPTCAITGTGIDEAVSMLANRIKARCDSSHP